MERYVCIHGHFYQPPRENPWLDDVEAQDSAAPYHDWNERITEECYRPNAASRILGPGGKVIATVNNYARMSFNFGPTLLYWLASHAPDVYRSIIAADKKSRRLFGGHGAAIAQAYNHMIMPLANAGDKHTQVIWGMRDFEYHFGRRPEGMWLPETAVDIETLEVLAGHGIKFTILAPRQALRVRRIGREKWTDVDGGRIVTTKPYLCRLPSGKAIDLFFYNDPVARHIADGDLLKDGERFALRLAGIFDENDESPQLAHIAADGETYGHHRRHGDMALAYCFHYIEANRLARPTVYGEYLEKFPPAFEVQIAENTAWSCSHGLERWRSNCGCYYGRFPSGRQQWRGPLRNAMDWLRDELFAVYERGMSVYAEDCRRVRDDYINVVNDRSPENVDRFLSSITTAASAAGIPKKQDPGQRTQDKEWRPSAALKPPAAAGEPCAGRMPAPRLRTSLGCSVGGQPSRLHAPGAKALSADSSAGRPLDAGGKVTVLKLLEMQRNAMLMYTSCGWFFDDICGIEAVQIMQYAAKAIQLVKEVEGADLEPAFMDLLRLAPANDARFADGGAAYEALAKSASVDLNRVAVHVAISSVFERRQEESDVYCYSVRIEQYDRLESGSGILAAGRVTIRSRIVLENYRVDFAVFHAGGHELICGVSAPMPDGEFAAVSRKLQEAFNGGDAAEVAGLINASFGPNLYSLKHLFMDDRRRYADPEPI